MVDRPSPNKSQLAGVLSVALCALLIRMAFVVAMHDSLNADPDAYRAIAENLRQNGVYGSTSSPTAFRPPLYPVILAALTSGGQVTVAMVAGLHVLFGVATVVLTYLLASKWRLGRWSYLACGLVAIDPILLNQSAFVMTETLATLLAVAGLYFVMRWNARPSLRSTILAGAVFGLACLCRPTFVPWLGLVAIVMALQNGVGRLLTRQSLGHSIALLLTATIFVSPWVVRNYLVLGVPKATTTHGGYTILLGNNPSFYRYLRQAPRGSTWDATELADQWQLRRFSASTDDAMWSYPFDDSVPSQTASIQRTEMEDDKFAYSLAKRYIAEKPTMFLRACFVRVSRLWQVMPYKTSSSESTSRVLLRMATGCWYSVLFVLAAYGLVSIVRSEPLRGLARSHVVWGLLLCFAFTAVHALYWSNMRMRAPLMPFLCLLAASGIAQITNRTSGRKP